MEKINLNEIPPFDPSTLWPMNKEELCQWLRIERTTLENYNMQGLPRFKMGNEVRYWPPSVIDWFQRRLVKGKYFEPANS